MPGVWGYVDRIGVAAGETVRFHVSAPAAYELTIVRLGRTALLDAPTDDAADRADVERLATFRHETATPQTLAAGSYIWVDGPPIPGGPVTMGTWLRLWRLPEIDVAQWAWYGLLGDLDFPAASRFALLVDHAGRVGVYAGDGGMFRHDQLHLSEAVLTGRLGEWVHLAASIEPGSPGRVTAYLDGAPIVTVEGEVPVSTPGRAARLRVGATAEGGAAADFLDGDIAQPFVAASVRGAGRGRAGGRRPGPVADRRSGPRATACRLGSRRGARCPCGRLVGQRPRGRDRPGRHLADRRPCLRCLEGRARLRPARRPGPRPRVAALERRCRGLRVVGHRRLAGAVGRSLGSLRRARPPRRPGGARCPGDHVRGRAPDPAARGQRRPPAGDEHVVRVRAPPDQRAAHRRPVGLVLLEPCQRPALLPRVHARTDPARRSLRVRVGASGRHAPLPPRPSRALRRGMARARGLPIRGHHRPRPPRGARAAPAVLRARHRGPLRVLDRRGAPGSPRRARRGREGRGPVGEHAVLAHDPRRQPARSSSAARRPRGRTPAGCRPGAGASAGTATMARPAACIRSSVVRPIRSSGWISPG